MTKEELKKREIDFLALQVLLCMEASGISPENHNSCLHILKKCDGTEITLKSAYYNVKRNICIITFGGSKTRTAESRI